MDQNLLLFCDSMTNLLYGLFSFDLIIILLKKKKHRVLWNLFILAFDVGTLPAFEKKKIYCKLFRRRCYTCCQ